MIKQIEKFNIICNYYKCNNKLQYLQSEMEPESKQLKQQNQKQKLINELLQFGFDQLYVLRAVQLTLDKEKAGEIIMKLIEEGPGADLTMYQYPVISQQPVMISEEAPLVQGNAPIRPKRAKMLFIVNGSLKMGKGKICAQVGHAVLGAYLQIEQTIKWDERDRQRLYSWQNSGGAKIVVRANDLKQMLDVQQKLKKLDIGINTYLVQDAGHTQIEAGSKTVLAVGPAFSYQIDPITDHLKLL